MRVGSLFSGIGGLDLGLEQAGLKVAWQVEIDPACREILDLRFGREVFGDVRSVHGHPFLGYPPVCERLGCLPTVDLICGGFPCQPFSRAGLRKGTDDPRWLWPEMHRLVREMEPRYVLVENVPGLASHGLGDVVSDLAQSGYDAEWDCLPAAAFGAPHIRDRVYLLAYAGERRPIPPGQTVFAGWTSSQLHAGWTSEPRLARVVDGPPNRVDRWRRGAIGRAVVPAVAEWIGRRLMAAESKSEARTEKEERQ